MNQHSKAEDFGTFTDPATLKIERLLPGPIERVWSYLTNSDLRQQWFASGDMKLQPDASFEFVWHDADWAIPAGQRPEGIPNPRRMQARVIACEPSTKLAFTWGETAEVDITLEKRGERVLLTLIHQRIADRGQQPQLGLREERCIG